MRFTRKARARVRGLWIAVFGEPPVIEADPPIMLDVLVRSLPVETYSVIRRDGVAPPLALDALWFAKRIERSGRIRTAAANESEEQSQSQVSRGSPSR